LGIRSTTRATTIGRRLRGTLLGSSSLGLDGEFQTNAQRFDIERLSEMRQVHLEEEKRFFLPASSASRLALTDRSGSLSELPLRTSFAPPLSKNATS
jgi:hypothetical protein